jgi:hypothetical protein
MDPGPEESVEFVKMELNSIPQGQPQYVTKFPWRLNPSWPPHALGVGVDQL